MSSGLLIPVLAGLCVGVAIVLTFSLHFSGTEPLFEPILSRPNSSEPPQVQLIVAEGGYPIGKHSGVRGSYCWSLVCADTGVLISNTIIGIEPGTIVQFQSVITPEVKIQPDELSAILYETNKLDVFSNFGDIQIASFRSGEGLHQLESKEKGTFVIDVPNGNYVLQIFARWNSGGNPDLPHGDVSYYYRVSVTDHTD